MDFWTQKNPPSPKVKRITPSSYDIVSTETAEPYQMVVRELGATAAFTAYVPSLQKAAMGVGLDSEQLERCFNELTDNKLSRLDRASVEIRLMTGNTTEESDIQAAKKNMEVLIGGMSGLDNNKNIINIVSAEGVTGRALGYDAFSFSPHTNSLVPYDVTRELFKATSPQEGRF